MNKAMPADWIIPDWPAPKNVRTLVTTRTGGVSQGAFASMNLGAFVNDEEAAVAQNRARLREHLPAEPKWLKQVHGTRVVDADQPGDFTEADAMLARKAHCVCAVTTADCLPLLLCNDAGTVIAAAHAGWRGLCAGVIENTVSAMNGPAGSLLAYLGPAIGAQNFEVGNEVRGAFMRHDAQAAAAFVAKENGKWLADIYQLARQRLNAAGVTRIYGGEFCTVSDARFFSHRRDKISGRMAALIWRAE